MNTRLIHASRGHHPIFPLYRTKKSISFSTSNKYSFSHLSDGGELQMVDVGDKEESRRVAVAAGSIFLGSVVFEKMFSNGMLLSSKGNVLTVAQISGIMAAKRTSHIIPLCHTVNLSHIQIHFHPLPGLFSVDIEATCSTTDRTGVEMEALMAVSTAALTIYDMCKSVSKSIRINNIRLVHKSGGRSTHDG